MDMFYGRPYEYWIELQYMLEEKVADTNEVEYLLKELARQRRRTAELEFKFKSIRNLLEVY